MNSIAAAQSFVVIWMALGHGLEDFTAKRENRWRTQRPRNAIITMIIIIAVAEEEAHSWPEVNAVEKIKFTKAGNYTATQKNISVFSKDISGFHLGCLSLNSEDFQSFGFKNSR